MWPKATRADARATQERSLRTLGARAGRVNAEPVSQLVTPLTYLGSSNGARVSPGRPFYDSLIEELHLIWSDLLSSGRVRRPSRAIGTGASCFVVLMAGERVVGDARSD